MMTRRRFLAMSGSSVAAGMGLYAWRVEPHWVDVVERSLPISNLPDELVGWRLVQLSDLHIGPRVDERYLLRSFQLVRKLAPELVVYTGDFANYDADLGGRAARLFSQLPLGRRGTFGILGNHDYGLGWSQGAVAQRVAGLAGDGGVRVLRNEAEETAGLFLVGLDELWANRFDLAAAFEGVPRNRATLVLSHNPDTVDLPGWDDYGGWILAGHTHGGQCKPPFLPPPFLPVRNRRYTSGAFALTGDRRLYINRGLGHLLRARFNARPEVTLFQLACA